MSLVSVFKQLTRTNLLILTMSVICLVGALTAQKYVTHYLLERDAYAVGMRWAEDIETNLDNIEELFSGNPQKSNAAKVLQQLSSVARIYRFEFADLDGNIVFSTDSDGPAPIKLGREKHVVDTDQSKGQSHSGPAGKVHAAHENVVKLKMGDGKTHPKYFAYIVHPIPKTGTQLGILTLYVDQTETQAMLRDTIFIVFSILAALSVLAFGLPTFFFLAGIKNKENARQKLYHQQTQFNAALKIMHQGFCVFDNDNNIIIANDRYSTLYNLDPKKSAPGVNLSEVIESRIEAGCFIGKDVKEYRKIMARLRNGIKGEAETFQLNDGRHVRVHNSQMANGDWLTIHEDITERTVAKLKTERQNTHFDLAISNITQGLCLFDGKKNLIVSNDIFATVFGLTPDMIRPGMHISEIVKLRVQHGHFIDEDSADIRTRIKGLADTKDISAKTDIWTSSFTDKAQIIQLTDGRYIEVLYRPMEDGGWLSTQEDVSERISAKQELEKRNERLDAALSTMSHGLAMYDIDRNIIVSNKRYATIYGLSEAAILPGMNISTIVDMRLAHGCHIGANAKEYRKEIDKMKSKDYSTHGAHKHMLNDGRTVEIQDYPMSNGGFLSVHEDVTDRHQAEEKIKFLADNDTLTGLPNRLQIHEILQATIDKVAKSDDKMALLYIDLDGFKEVNDTLGHPVGDHVLSEIGGRLGKIMDKTTVAGRMAGDEFVVIIKEFDDPAELELLCEQICTSLAKPIRINHDLVDLSASIGLAIGPPEDGNAETLIKYSDLALYQAKADGGNAYYFFEEKMFTQAKERQRMASDLRTAISKNELLLHYQPQVDLRSGTIDGYEALVRWQHEELGMISPFHFIGLAEETGQICEIGEWVLRTACEYAVNWPNAEKVSVNLSPVQFKRQDVVAMVRAVLQETGLDPLRLELEITEGVLIQNTDVVIATLQQLADMGVSIALDDFGTGYSSLSYLTTFPFDKIKIDKSFIDNLGKDNSEVTAIISMIIGLGRSLDAVITAEGIEEPIQHELLRAVGCNQGQGYLYGRPLPEILNTSRAMKIPMQRQTV